MKNVFYGYIDNGIEIELSRDCVANCFHSGSCDADCEAWVDVPEIKKQFDKVKKERLINHILETGADHTQKELNKWTKKRLCIWVLWDMCATIYDSEEYQDEESEDD